ncbi:MAG: hypothetical protein HY905_00440 [Deltaproteobacteria bacterium]|nr:hypothetical protein [Deltaproteobacteria bacterium]
MAEHESMALLVAGCLGAWWWGRWHWDLLSVRTLRPATASRALLFLAPWLGAGATFFVLRRWASFDVRDNGAYLAFYMVLGAAWVGGFVRLVAPRLGLSPRNDALERRNPAAAVAVAGLVLGLALAYAGGNIGDGPGWWVVLFCAVLSAASFFLLWLLAETLGGLSEAVTVERELSAGLRAAGFFLGLGAILGRAVAGDWVSAVATVRDFALRAWPAVPLALLAGGVERLLRPTPVAPSYGAVGFGVLPGVIYAAAGAVVVVELGPW